MAGGLLQLQALEAEAEVAVTLLQDLVWTRGLWQAGEHSEVLVPHS